MPTFVDEIIKFNIDVLGIPERCKNLPDDEIRLGIKCLIEEATELEDALNERNAVKCIDAVCDSIYFAVGILYKMGLNSQEIKDSMSIVHAANMAKKLGTQEKRSTGHAADAVKPVDWVPPEESLKAYLLL